jgi:peptidyl-prolyl cis-trans isomerase D
MEAGTISDPVKGADGWHVIQLREVREEKGKAFEDVRAELEREYLDGERERHFSDLTARLVDVIYRDPTTLETASKELEFPIQRTATFTRAGGPGIARPMPDVLEAVFSDAVLTDGNVSDVIDLGARSRRRRAHRRPHPGQSQAAPDRARPGGRRAARRAPRRRSPEEQRDAALANVGSLDALQALATERTLEVKTADAVGRTGATVDPAIARAAFSLPHPTADKAAVGTADLADGTHAVIVLTAVADGDPGKTDVATRQMLMEQLAQTSGTVESTELLKALRKEAKIEVAEARL